jgi:PcRGLX-like protein C-terminal alpha/alpha toroid domain/PcRGLX-like N-terminal RIFT barrel domain/PcRGLX-like protein central beta sandwich domain/Galactose oxidase, central domain
MIRGNLVLWASVFTIIVLYQWQMVYGYELNDSSYEIEKLKNRRQVLLQRYTENHPEIQILSRQIDELRQQLGSTAQHSQAGPLTDGSCHSEKSGPNGETVLTNGRLRLVLGQVSGGFIDEAYLDRNQDGDYEAGERIGFRPKGEAAVVVSYTEPYAGFSEGVVHGKSIEARVNVERVDVDGCNAEVSGTLEYGKLGRSEFLVTLQTRYGAETVSADFEFEPLKGVPNLILKEASLRIFGNFDNRDPDWRRHNSSQGVFRINPRPESSHQFLTWQHGGHLVETPWYWREWSAWSLNTGPITTREGHVPGETLEYYMQDNTHGIRVGLQEPAAVSPVEISGSGFPSYISILAWTPRVPGQRIHSSPERLFMKNIEIVFYVTGLEDLVLDRGKYSVAYNAAIKRSSEVLKRSIAPALSNISNPRLPEELRHARLEGLLQSQYRGWGAEVERARSKLKATPGKISDTKARGIGWFNVEMNVPDSQRLSGSKVPARGGVPFPRGALHDTDKVRLKDNSGKEVPVQVDRLAEWPDGSVKWLLLTTIINAEYAVGKNYRVEYGEGVSRSATFDSVPTVTTIDDGSVMVDTGALKFTLKKSGSGFLDSVWFDRNANGSYDIDEQVVKPEQKARRNRFDLAAFSETENYQGLAFHSEKMEVEASAAVVDSIEVERHGAASIHLLVKGHYEYEKLGREREKEYQNKGNAFRLRYTAYAGQPYLEVKHWFVFEGNSDREMAHDLGLSFAPEMGDALTFETQGDEKKFDAPISGREDVGIYQDNPHSFEFWLSNSSTTLSGILAAGRSVAGWATVRDSTQGITFGLRKMRESYAKELALRDDRIEINLWPRRARLLDTRRYSRQFVDGESTSYGQGAAQGVARSHDIFLVFHRSEQTQEAQHTATLLQAPVFIVAHPEWYTKTQAAGKFGTPDIGKFPQWESGLDDGLSYLLMHRDLWAWYGFYDYGDFQQRPRGDGSWGKRDGRWGWANNEALVDMWIYEQFLRTGRREYLDAALAMTQHVLNVDLINAVPYKGNSSVLMQGHRHNVNHWGDGYVGIRVAAPQGFRLGYYLTGDLQIYEQLERILENHSDSMHSYDRSADTGLGIYLFFWEATGDASYLRALNAYVDFQVAHDSKFGHMANRVWDFKQEAWSGELKESYGNAPTSFFFQNFGSAYTLMEFAELTGREDVIDMLVRYARQTINSHRGKWEAAYCHYRLMAFAYRHSGDDLFLEYASKNAGRLKVPADRFLWPTTSALASFDNKLSMLVWASQGLPYLMEAIKLTGGSIQSDNAMRENSRNHKSGGPKQPTILAPPRADGANSVVQKRLITTQQFREAKALDSIPANKWVVQAPEIAGGTLSHLTYLPAQRSMLYWGYLAPGSTRYDVELFDMVTRLWSEQIPDSSGGELLPNPHQKRGTVLTKFQGKERLTRPGLPMINRQYWVAGQLCYIPTLDKVLYFAGGATFYYDPGERVWEDLAIPLEHSPPDVMLGSLAWDPVKERVILFGGGYISAYKLSNATPWNIRSWDDAAKRATWAFNPVTRSWEQLQTGSARLHDLFGQAGAISELLEVELSAVRSHALETMAVSGVPAKDQIAIRIQELAKEIGSFYLILTKKSGLTDKYEIDRAKDSSVLLKTVQSNLERGANLLAQDSWRTFHLLESTRWILHDAIEEIAPSPLPRYYGRMVTDTKNNVIVLFGGHGGNRIFADTWIFDPLENRWRKSQGTTHPPLTRRPAMGFDKKRGVVFLATQDKGWIYDVGTDRWKLLPTAASNAFFSGWTSIEYAPSEDVFVAMSTGDNLFNPNPRRTALLRLDLGVVKESDTGTHDGPTWSWLNSKYTKNIASLPSSDAAYQARVRRQTAFFKNLPKNKWRRVEDPNYIAQDRSYGSFTYDWDREQIVLWGGGHSAYMGNEVSQYDLKSNTWLESWAPDVPPWPFGHPDGPGWHPPLYHRIGTKHGYHHYSYNSDTKMVAFFSGSLFYDPDLMRWSSRSLSPVGQGSRGLMVEMSGASGLITVSPNSYRDKPFGVWTGSVENETLTRIEGSDTPIYTNDRAKPVYDPKRHRILWFGVRSGNNKKNNELWAFDLNHHQWENLSPNIGNVNSPAPENRMWGNTYSPKHDVMLLLPGNQGTWVYDAQANYIREIGPHPDNSQWSTKGVVYDEDRDVFVALAEGRYGTGPVSVWVMRYSPNIDY